MTRYLALFGSLNVGSANRISMADLRHAFAREDIDNVETVIASGNVLFDYEARPSEGLEEMLAYILSERFDIDSFVAVRTRAELAATIEANPFAADGDAARVHTHFLGAQPAAEAFDALFAAYSGRGPERMAAGERCLYVDYVEGAGRSRLTPAFIARRLGTPGTARNHRSLPRILDKMPMQG